MKDSEAFQSTFYNFQSGNKIRKCIQCGTCSSSCPMTDTMDLGPRSLFALIRDGDMEEVMHSNSPWMCVSCYQCTNRCPQQIPVTELMYSLKRLITQSRKKVKPNLARDLHRSFSSSLSLFGRVTDTFIMAKYSIKHPFTGISSIPLAIQLMKRERVELKMKHVVSPLRFRRLFKRLRR
jgi:heterodisulfide reductase subunit C